MATANSDYERLKQIARYCSEESSVPADIGRFLNDLVRIYDLTGGRDPIPILTKLQRTKDGFIVAKGDEVYHTSVVRNKKLLALVVRGAGRTVKIPDEPHRSIYTAGCYFDLDNAEAARRK